MELLDTYLTRQGIRLIAKLHIGVARFITLIILAVFIAAVFLPASSASSARQFLRLSQPSSASASTLEPLMAPAPFAETIDTFAPDCSTPKTSFNLGDTVCAKVSGAAAGGSFVERRFQWANTEPFVVRQFDVVTSSQSDPFTLPTTNTSVVSGQTIDNRGTWRVNLMDTTDGSVRATAFFTVHNPNSTAVDLEVSDVARPDSNKPAAGTDVVFVVLVKNNGPDDAVATALRTAAPSNTTFVSLTQDSGPAFNCASGGGTSTCAITSFAAGAEAHFSFTYHVTSGTPDGTQITDTADISSTTTERDSANNSSSATVTVATPTCTITPPADITQNNDLDQQGHALSGAVVTYPDPTTSSSVTPSSCGTVNCTLVSGSFFPIGANVVTCSDGVNDPVHFNVTIQDTEAPTISCPADVTAPESSHGSGSANVTYPDPIATDNSGHVTVTTDHPSGSSFPVGTTTVTATATDAAGHTATCTFHVTVVQSDCTITCPSNITQPPDQGQNGAIVNYPAATTTGTTCGTVTYSQASGTFFPVGTTTVRATAAGGETCTFTVTITTDTTPPTITCPSDVVQVTPGGSCQANVDPGTATATDDNPGVTVSSARSDGLALTAPFPVGETIITWTATDAAGNTASCNQSVKVTENVPPTVTAPAPVTVNVNSTCDNVEVPNFVTNLVASDNCTPRANLEITQSPAAETLVGVGSYTVTITVKDTSENTTVVTTTFNVVDNTPPTITCPANITQSTDPGSCSANINQGTATATDNCGSPTVTGTRSDGKPLTDPYPKGTTTITWTATDGSNNSASCTQTVTVNDTEKPTVTCPANVTRSTDPGSCSATINLSASATDNCDSNPTVTGLRSDGQPLNAPFPKGTTVVTWTATDSSGNSSTTCAQTITVNDTEAPAISCPANITTATDPGSCSATVNPGTATATDNCDSNPVVVGTRSDSLPLNAPYPKGTTTITWTATDTSGNHSSCTQTVTVNDNEPPTITCPANITTDTEPGTCSAHVNPGTATASDNCGSTTVTGTRSDGRPLSDTYPKGTTTITWTATDSSNNQSSCTQTVTVVDNEAPTITTNGQTPVLWPANHAYHTFNVTDFVTGASDNCDTLSVSNVVIQQVTSDEAENGAGSGNTLNDIVIAADCKSVQLRAERENPADGRVYTITFKVTDSSGNVGTKTSQVHVPKNLGVPVVDSGPHYTVTGTCP